MALNITYAILGTSLICTGMIMDAEILVLMMFVAFVGLAYHYGSSVVDGMIKTETAKIGTEFDTFFELQKTLLKTLIKYHVLQVLVISQIKELLEFSKGEITNIISAKKALLDATLATQMEQKLSYLASKELAVASKVQSDAATFVTNTVLEVFTTENKNKDALKAKVLTENLAQLEQL
jgi:hypothetical protein